MKISVVIPAYNEETRIASCLESVLNQTRPADEVIVVNNNSTDDTPKVVSKFKSVTLIDEKEQGIIPARNAGFDKAMGNIIVRTDADSILPKNFIENVEKDFSNNPNAVGVSMPVTFYDMPIVKNLTYLYYPYMFFPRLLIGHYCLVGPAMAIRKSAWKKIRKELCMDPSKVHEDVDVSIHISKYGDIYHDRRILVKASGRRAMYKPWSFFGEYTLRFFKMLRTHH